MSEPLRYNISSWFQLPKCRSNLSRDLYITVKQIVDDGSHRLEGINIAVQHKQYGVLFACLINAEGSLLLRDENSLIIWEFSSDEILKILRTFGFDITFHVNQHLGEDQIAYLTTLNGLGFDKIRKIYVSTPTNTILTSYPPKQGVAYSEYLVAFNVVKCPDWIANDYICPKQTFLAALNSSGAMNLTDLPQTKGFDWTWLTYVANIEDIINDNNNGG